MQPDFLLEVFLEALVVDEDGEPAPELGGGHGAVRSISLSRVPGRISQRGVTT
jgi:hypothetical protein